MKGSQNYAYFGELMSRLCIRQHVNGVVIDGLTRDSTFTKNLRNLGIFSKGYSPVDIKGRGKVQDTDVDIIIGNIPVNVGDWIFGDFDGIVIIPNKIKDDLFLRVTKCLEGEKQIIREIENGESICDILKNHKSF